MTDKYASEYPLPGGVDQYFNSLITLLKRVSDSPPEQQELVGFVFQEYPRTRGSTAVGQYLAHITRSGLWAIKDGKYRLTPDGSSLVEKVESDCDAARHMLMQMKLQTIAGYEEMFGFLSEASRTFDEIDSALKTALQTGWKSKNQTSFRLSWLRSLGYAEKEGHSYGLTPAGRAVLDSLPAPKKKDDEGELTPPPEEKLSPLVEKAIQLADNVDKAALSGKDGTELEQETCKAFAFLGFDAEVISGPGNPDVVIHAPMGASSYRVLIDTKNRPARSSLEDCLGACRRYGPSPSEVWAASPFFDPAPPGEIDKIAVELCKGMARGVKRSLTFCVPRIGNEEEAVRLAAPKSLLYTAQRRVDRLSVRTLPQVDQDKNPRPWHAKMLALSTPKYNALMIGSSNFTKAGMGVGGVHNAEVNLVYVARREAYAREAGALDECWPVTTRVDDPDTVEWQGPQEEMVEEEQASAVPVVPFGFVSARYRAGQNAALVLAFVPEKVPPEWRILGGIKHDQTILDSAAYAAAGMPELVEVAWRHDYAPGKLLVTWDDEQASWSVNVEDQSKLPVPREIESMTAQDMLYILAASDAGAAIRIVAGRQQAESPFDEDLDSAVPPDLDPLRRYNLQDTFLRRVRRQARLLAAARHNLERPVWSEQALQWRLTGMIGVQRLADRIAKGFEDGSGDASEVVLNLADLLLMLGDVEYRETDTALSRRKFNRHYKQFLRQLSDSINTKVQTARGLPRDVRQFWSRVHRRSQQ